jgi:predicted GH43/DUF377 family glycosyl hydrolase
MSVFLDESVPLERRNETEDIVKRLGVITADKVHLLNHPAENPVTVFNPSLILKNETIHLYARIVLGYFTYSSAVMEINIPLEDMEDLERGRYRGRIILKPDNKYDIWGVEDPRACTIAGKATITYCGRTVNYFRPGTNRVLPIVATHEGKEWRKRCVFQFDAERQIVSDKDAFLTDLTSTLFFHRIHTLQNEYHCVVNDVPRDVLHREPLQEVSFTSARIWIAPAPFEDKIGWGTPLVRVDNDYVTLLHGVDKETQWYKVFAVLMDRNAELKAVTRDYIMAPKESYEVYGDRPFTVFPCGMCKLDDKLLISYGAADYASGFGEIDLSHLMSLLDANSV